MKWSFVTCTSFFIAGLFLYIAACPAESFALLVVARCVLGVGAQLIPYWYTARAVGVNKRTKVNQYVNAAIASGYAIGPFLSAIMYVATKDVEAAGGVCLVPGDGPNCPRGVRSYGD